MKAFPIDVNTASIDKWQGMDLRDYFAAKAMTVFISEDTQKNYPEQWGMQEVARVAYEIADAMMKAREQ